MNFNFKKSKLCLLFFTLLLIYSNANSENTNTRENSENHIFFDAVEKKLELNEILPKNFKKLINNWFSKNIKVNGLEGLVIIGIENFSENLENIEDGKNYKINVDFSVTILNETMSSKKLINISISEYSFIKGYFKLSDVDTMINQTQINLIERLNNKLTSKI